MMTIIFTDLDGTLLDSESYSYDEAREALAIIVRRNVPLVICSSKTRGEIEVYRRKLFNTHPYISENGGGIFIPKNYFDDLDLPDIYHSQICDELLKISIGVPYSRLRDALAALRDRGFKVRGFGDMSAQDVAQLTGLGLSEAQLARDREFDEPFVYDGDDIVGLRQAIDGMGFNYTKGLLHHILGGNNKGIAVSILRGFYRRKYGTITSIALGDSPNDLPMLAEVDHPVIVKNKDGGYSIGTGLPAFIKSGGIGPAGWNSAVVKLLSRF